MRTRRGLQILAVVSPLMFAPGGLPASAADSGAAVVIGGEVEHPISLTPDDLRKFPPVSVPISFATDRGPESATYVGALLWAIVYNAAPIDVPGRNTKLRHSISVIGRDGYAVTLSEGELDPNFEGKSVILAYEKDGKPLSSADGIRLIVPGDRHGGRAVRDVVLVSVQ